MIKFNINFNKKFGSSYFLIFISLYYSQPSFSMYYQEKESELGGQRSFMIQNSSPMQPFLISPAGMENLPTLSNTYTAHPYVPQVPNWPQSTIAQSPQISMPNWPTPQITMLPYYFQQQSILPTGPQQIELPYYLPQMTSSYQILQDPIQLMEENGKARFLKHFKNFVDSITIEAYEYTKKNQILEITIEKNLHFYYYKCGFKQVLETMDPKQRSIVKNTYAQYKLRHNLEWADKFLAKILTVFLISGKPLLKEDFMKKIIALKTALLRNEKDIGEKNFLYPRNLNKYLFFNSDNFSDKSPLLLCIQPVNKQENNLSLFIKEIQNINKIRQQENYEEIIELNEILLQEVFERASIAFPKKSPIPPQQVLIQQEIIRRMKNLNQLQEEMIEISAKYEEKKRELEEL